MGRIITDAGGVMKTGMLFLDGQWINLNNALIKNRSDILLWGITFVFVRRIG